jgi:hypothetical protein
LRIRSFAIIVALDTALSGDGLQISEFCQTYHLSRRSVFRYLAFLHSLGLETVVETENDDGPPVHRYAQGQGLFTPLAEELVTDCSAEEE